VTRKIDDGVFVPGEEDVEFDLNVVNIEEHGQREPFPYILPPGIDREENYQSAFRGSFLNEQSLSLEMCNIPRQDSRGVYKVLNMNMREYERMKLFVHAETEDLQDEDLSVFVRIGSDYKNNYYEYELPLTFSDAGENGDDLQRQVWPLTNDIDIDLNALKDLKLERNENGVGRNVIYSGVQPGDSIGMIKVRGNPNLGLVNTILIGVRNNSDQDDFCAEVWLNELRLVGLDETGGAAALGRLDIQLADFGNLALSGNYSTIGWGAIDKQLLDRNREEIAAYDIATNLELGKFLPEKVGLKVPFFVQYSNNTKKPKYDPYDLDVELDEKLKSAETPSERDSIRDQAIDKTVIKTISLNNVQKQRTKQGKPMPWDISNFTASYSFTSTERTDPILEQDDITHHTGSLDYQFNLGTNYIEPFKKLIKGDKWLKFIKDINLNPIPNSFSMRNSVDRKQRQRQYRFAADDFSKSTSRQFLWNRDYRVNWDITRSIKFNYFATNKAAIDELSDSGYDFVNDVQYDMDDKQARKDYVWDNVQNFGRNKQFDQNFDISYKLPLNKFGLLDWITADLKYSATYSWNAAAINVDTFGNNISNGRDESVRLNLNFERLYNKSKFLSKINKGKSKGRGNSRVRNTNEKEDPAQPNASSKRRSAREKDVPTIARVVLRPLMTIRRARFNYTNNYSTFVPSFVMQPELLGLSSGFKAPGWDFIAGLQPDRAWFTDNAGDALDVGKADGYWSKHSCVSQEIIKGYNQRWDAQLTLEPVKDFKIDVDLERNYQRNRSVLFKLFEGETAAENEWDFGQEYEVGSYTISYLTIKTLFKDGENNIDGLFDQFKANLGTISQRLDPDGAEHPIYGSGYKLGYSLKNQEVIIPAFIAAYREVDAQTVGLDLFDEAPRPNWSLTYNGLTKIPWFKERFTRLSLTHNYKSTLTVNQYTSDLRFDDTASDPFINFDEVSQDYYSKFTFPQIVIRESMSPLIRIDVSTVNDLSFNFEYGKQRTLSLDPDNQQLNETRGTNITAGFGYTLKDVYLSFIPGAKPPKKKPKSRRGQDTNDPDNQNQDEFTGNTLKISCDFSIRDDRTKQHTWGLDITARDTRGQRAFTLSPAIDYTVNKYLTLRLFFDYRKTTPYTNLSYPITNSRGGIRFRFTLN
jgi:cell surface protein SprA